MHRIHRRALVPFPHPVFETLRGGRVQLRPALFLCLSQANTVPHPASSPTHVDQTRCNPIEQSARDITDENAARFAIYNCLKFRSQITEDAVMNAQ